MSMPWICSCCKRPISDGCACRLVEPANDPVANPKHYTSTAIEVIDVIETFELGFRLANVVKYVLRAGKKGDKIEDLKKAKAYLSREIAALEGRKSWE